MNMTVRNMEKSDWKDVAEIYREGIETGNATFATDIPAYKEWDVSHLPDCRLVATVNDEIAAWAALSSVSSRCVYGGIAEVSIYVSAKYREKGIGTSLLTALVEKSEEHGYWTLQSGVFGENIGTLKLHEKCGFRTVGYRERIGCDATGRWRNTYLLERRSRVVGIEDETS